MRARVGAMSWRSGSDMNPGPAQYAQAVVHTNPMCVGAGDDLMEQVWQEAAQALVERYVRLESVAATEFGDTLSPSSGQLAAALHDAARSR